MRRAKEQIPNPVKNQWEVAVEVVNQQSPDCGEKEYLCTRLVRMDQFIHNLGLVYSRKHGDLRLLSVRMASLFFGVAANTVRSGTTNQHPAL